MTTPAAAAAAAAAAAVSSQANPQMCDGHDHHSVTKKDDGSLAKPAPPALLSTTTAKTSTEDRRKRLVPSTSSLFYKPNSNILHPHGIFRIGLVLYDLNSVSKTDAAIRAITNPASSCQLVALSVIEANEQKDTDSVRHWLSNNVTTSYDYCLHNSHINASSMSLSTVRATQTISTSTRSTSSVASTMPLHFGMEGYHKMLETKEIDAVYICVPTSHQPNCVLKALNMGNHKHVLLNDPRSTSYETFMEQVNAANAHQRFIQFSTMFVHHYRVQRFLDSVTYERFGEIESIHAQLSINYKDVDKLGGPSTTFPLKPGDGCLRRLARYCVLMALLMQQQQEQSSQAGSSKKKHHSEDDEKDSNSNKKINEDCGVALPISAQITHATRQHSNNEPIQATGIVKFAQGRQLTFNVAYSAAPTRQVVKVEGRHRHATMTDFVIPHPDGLSTFRLYDKEHSPTTGRYEIVKGQALDVPSGPPQDVMMWRRFASVCRSVQEGGSGDYWDDEEGIHRQARSFTQVALHLKRVLKALEESYNNDCKEVALLDDNDDDNAIHHQDD